MYSTGVDDFPWYTFLAICIIKGKKSCRPIVVDPTVTVLTILLDSNWFLTDIAAFLIWVYVKVFLSTVNVFVVAVDDEYMLFPPYVAVNLYFPVSNSAVLYV